MKDIFKHIVYGIIQRLMAILSRLSFERGRIFMLHHVGEHENEFCISPENLTLILKRYKDKTIKLSEWQKSKEVFYAFTIDDVPEDFFYNGYPIFVKYSVPFTLFISTSLLDTPGYITSQQLIEMLENPLCDIGSHGTEHSFFKGLSAMDRIDFLKDSKRKLEQICSRPIDLFAFPYGSYYACGFCDRHLVNEYYKYGFGTVNAPITSPELLKAYFLPRINIDQKWIIKNLEDL